MGVDDFLYRAALVKTCDTARITYLLFTSNLCRVTQERNERLDGLRQSKEEELREEASKSRVNKHSEDLLRKKFVSHCIDDFAVVM